MPLIKSKSGDFLERELKPETLAYVGGFFDGEGCVNFTRNTYSNSLVIRAFITNTNLSLLQLIQANFGGRISTYHHKKNPTWKPMHIWNLQNRHAVRFLEKIEPYLVIKADQVTIAQSWEFLRDEPKVWRGENKEIWDDYLLLERQLKWLNKKGVHSEPEPYAQILEGTEYALN